MKPFVLGASVFLAAAAMASGPPAAPAAGPARSTLAVAGLKAPVTVRRDARGIPYIEASSAHDLFFAQGFVTAGDRLWQMDLLRRSARGELAEIFGKDVLEQDVQMRTFGFGRLADGLVTRVSPRLREALTAYAEGVNASVAGRGETGLPSEFAILGYRPKPWLPSDSLVIGKLFALDLDMSWPGELAKASLMDLPGDLLGDLFIEESPLDVVLLGAAKTSNEGAGAGKEAAGATTRGSLAPSPPLDTHALRLSKGPAALDRLRAALRHGRDRLFGLAASNNWVIAGKRSATGKPLLANDPHLSPSAPSIWYMTHLTGPGFHAAGVTAPGVVGILIGHNDRIAWGVTNLMGDVQDLYAERFDAAGKVATPAGSRDAEIRKERILVRAATPGAAAEVSEHETTSTRHGPIVADMGSTRYALRWTALDPDACEVCAFFDIDGAADWKQFQAAVARHSGPPLNFVYADTSNHIGWIGAGRIPVRASGDGTVPADGATDAGAWSGYVPSAEMPRLFDPRDGLIVTANNRVVGTGYKHTITHAWVVPYRARRIQDLLAARPRIAVEDCQAVQGDTVSLADAGFAREMAAMAQAKIQGAQRPAGSPEPDADWSAIADTLAGWDGRAHEDSRVMPLVAAARTLFVTKILDAALGPERGRAYGWPNRDTLIDKIAHDRPARWLPKEYASYDDLFLACWREGRAALAKKAGDDAAQLTWGKVADPVVFAHPLAGIPDAGAPFQIEPIPATTGGSGETVNAGPAVSMRFIADCADWDRTRQGIALGESGDPASPHWKDQLDAWRGVKTPAFPFSAASVARAAIEIQRLVPQSDRAKAAQR